jgi:predicted amidophosphoribosyltransferase
MPSCINCKTNLEAEALFCEECGTQQPQSIFCEDCGTKLEAAVIFCDACGAKTDKDAKIEKEPTWDSAAAIKMLDRLATSAPEQTGIKKKKIIQNEAVDEFKDALNVTKELIGETKSAFKEALKDVGGVSGLFGFKKKK